MSNAQTSSDAVSAWLSSSMAKLPVAAPQVNDGWLPKEVGTQMIAALRWARLNAGRVGPAGFGFQRWPEANLSDEAFAEEGWGVREFADPPQPMRLQETPAQISRHLAALEWPLTYLLPHHEGSARIVGLWAACKAHKRPFDAAVRAKNLHRSFAYKLRDRGLSLISQGLDRDGIQVKIER